MAVRCRVSGVPGYAAQAAGSSLRSDKESEDGNQYSVTRVQEVILKADCKKLIADRSRQRDSMFKGRVPGWR